jgi:hypothetical protein
MAISDSLFAPRAGRRFPGVSLMRKGSLGLKPHSASGSDYPAVSMTSRSLPAIAHAGRLGASGG